MKQAEEGTQGTAMNRNVGPPQRAGRPDCDPMELATERSECQAVILAGGTGTALYPVTDTVPKPLLPVAGRPLLLYQLELLEHAGFAGMRELGCMVTRASHGATCPQTRSSPRRRRTRRAFWRCWRCTGGVCVCGCTANELIAQFSAISGTVDG